MNEKELAQDVYNRIKNCIPSSPYPWKAMAITAAVSLGIGLGIGFYWAESNRPAVLPDVSMSQQDAKNPVKIQEEAGKAGVPLTDGQAKEVAQKVAAATKPNRIVETDRAHLRETVEKERKAAGADLAIVTDPSKPGTAPKLDDLFKTDTLKGGSALPAGTGDTDRIQLNQYNIQAYKQKIDVVTIATRSLGYSHLQKVDLPKILFILPKGGVGYVGPYIGVHHNGLEHLGKDMRFERAEAGITIAF